MFIFKIIYLTAVYVLFLTFQENKGARKDTLGSQQNGMLPFSEEANPENWESGWSDKGERKRLKAPTAAKIAARLSPKSTRKKVDIKTALIKVGISFDVAPLPIGQWYIPAVIKDPV